MNTFFHTINIISATRQRIRGENACNAEGIRKILKFLSLPRSLPRPKKKRTELALHYGDVDGAGALIPLETWKYLKWASLRKNLP